MINMFSRIETKLLIFFSLQLLFILKFIKKRLNNLIPYLDENVVYMFCMQTLLQKLN